MPGKRGRPTVANQIYGEHALAVETIYDGSFRSKRSIADTIYATEAMRLFKEAASDIPNLNTIYDPKRQWYSRGILCQLGRMLMQDSLPAEHVLQMAKEACALKSQNPQSSKEVEKFLL